MGLLLVWSIRRSAKRRLSLYSSTELFRPQRGAGKNGVVDSVTKCHGKKCQKRKTRGSSSRFCLSSRGAESYRADHGFLFSALLPSVLSFFMFCYAFSVIPPAPLFPPSFFSQKYSFCLDPKILATIFSRYFCFPPGPVFQFFSPRRVQQSALLFSYVVLSAD
jgi:hypothetical protein